MAQHYASGADRPDHRPNEHHGVEAHLERQGLLVRDGESTYLTAEGVGADNGVFAPNSKHRMQVTPAKRGKVKRPRSLDEDQTPAERRAAMTWAQRLKQVFDIPQGTLS